MQVMQSNKWTFSLASLVVLLALGFAVAPVMAHKAEKGNSHMNVTFTIDRSIVDVSSEETKTGNIDDDIQIDAGRVRAYDPAEYPREVELRNIGADAATTTPVFTALIEFDRMVKIHVPELASTDVTVGGAPGAAASGTSFGLDDLELAAYDRDGRPIINLDLFTLAYDFDAAADPQYTLKTGDELGAFLSLTNPGGTQQVVPGELAGRQFTLDIYKAALESIETLLPTGRGGDFEIATLIITLKSHSVAESSLELDLARIGGLTDDDALETGEKTPDDLRKAGVGPIRPHRLRVDLVDVDEGNPRYHDSAGADIDVTAPTEDAPYHATDPMRTDNPDGFPTVVSITRLHGTSGDINTPLGYGLDKNAAADADKFDVKIVLSEKPAEFNMDYIDVENGEVVSLSDGFGFGNAVEGTGDTPARAAVMPPYSEGGYAPPVGTDASTDPIPDPTGRDNQYWEYRATIDPSRATADDVVITIKEFDDMVLPEPKTYKPLTLRQRKTTTGTGLVTTRLVNGREILTLPVLVYSPDDAPDVTKAVGDALLAHEYILPERTVIPAGGYLVLAQGKEAGAGVRNVTAEKYEVKGDVASINSKLLASELLYNVKYEIAFPYPGNDLENYFRNGATIQLVYADIAGLKADENKKTGYPGATNVAINPGDLIISEIMWGRNAAAIGKGDKTDPVYSQWIELHNTTDEPITVDKNEWALVFGRSSPSFGSIIDTVGNIPSTGYWEVTVGQSAIVSDVKTVGLADDKKRQIVTRTDTVSMYRGISAAGEVMDGEAQASWFASVPPSINTHLGTVGSPGAASPTQEGPAPPAPPTKPVVVEPTVPDATDADIMISEIMVASDGGRFPQWIELTNKSTGDVSLMGWSVVIENDPTDDDVIASRLSIDIGDVEVGVDKDGDPESVLIVSKTTPRNSGVGTGKGDLRAERIVDAQGQLSPETARYQFLSEKAFKISLKPKQKTGITAYGDTVGNLGEGWDLPMAEGHRSSIIRREMGTTAEIDGTDALGWLLASGTMMDGAYRLTYYGHQDDVGTPGYDAGGALPVELSKFNAARNRLTGQVVITWETQSELNNAGFYIKRSQQPNGKFLVINPTMIAGAGTTAEKQSYTYTDASAKPNVVYYYQIEDVSLDGNRQTLTRAHRLKGHIGAAGKLTTRWGELKTQE